MAHITVEYSDNIAEHHSIDRLIEVIHDTALESGLLPIAGLRTRAAERDRYLVADGNPQFGFVAIACRLGPGREPESKKALMAAILSRAESHLAGEGSELAIAWSIEITELDAEYRINHNQVRSAIEEQSS